MGALTALLGGRGGGQEINAVAEVPDEEIRLGRLDVRDARVDLAEQGLERGPGQRGTQTEVRPAAAEGDVRVRAAQDVEAERVVEDVLVPVAGAVPQHDVIAGLD